MRLPSFKPALYVTGALLFVLGVAMVLPGLVDAALDDGEWSGFLISAAATSLVGLLLYFSFREDQVVVTRREAFLLLVLTWIGTAAFAAFPFVLSPLKVSYCDAFFETISGLTTTGSTVLTGLDKAPPGILLWRSILQWLGGVGIVLTAIVLLPFLRVGGMQLFRMESSDTHEKVVAKVDQLGWNIIAVYITITCGSISAYRLGGMSWFDAVNHAFTAVSTGGFSTYDASLGHFDSLFILWVSVASMIAGSLPFSLYIKALRGNPSTLFEDTQVRGFLGFLVVVALIMTLWLQWEGTDYTTFEAFTQVIFSVTSIVTTTGFVSVDYTQWGALAVAAFFALLFVGGCTGSTAGAIKIFRFQISWLLFKSHIHRLVTPSLVEVCRYGERRISEDIAISVLLFFFVYIGVVGFLTLFLGTQGLDWITAISAAASAVGNVGPGLGEIVGPVGNFASLSDASKWALSAGMLLGRLEFFSILAVFTIRFWKG